MLGASKSAEGLLFLLCFPNFFASLPSVSPLDALPAPTLTLHSQTLLFSLPRSLRRSQRLTLSGPFQRPALLLRRSLALVPAAHLQMQRNSSVAMAYAFALLVALSIHQLALAAVVFNVGLPRTGTTSFHYAMASMNHSSQHVAFNVSRWVRTAKAAALQMACRFVAGCCCCCRC